MNLLYIWMQLPFIGALRTFACWRAKLAALEILHRLVEHLQEVLLLHEVFRCAAIPSLKVVIN